jgi:predicted permease
MTLHDLKLRVRALLAPGRVERELDDELAFHIERETQDLIARGLDPAEARMRAKARFGSVTVAADECRDARGIAFIDNLVRDVGYAARTFRRAPLSALTIVLTVALGLGLIASVFTLFNSFFFRVDAVRAPEEMFAVERMQIGGDGPIAFTQRDFESMRRETGVFAGLVAMRSIAVRGDGRAMNGMLVSGNFFPVLGVVAALGRAIVPLDDNPGSPRVIVLSHRARSRFFARDPTVVGRVVRLNGVTFEIAGVAPDGFRGLRLGPPDFWAPLAFAPDLRPTPAGTAADIQVAITGRLPRETAIDTATASLSSWVTAHPPAAATSDAPLQIRLRPRQGTIANDAWEALLVFVPLFFAFGLILAIACANVANLLLARGIARQREIGVRLSLGASRARIVRQLLTESLLLAMAAAAIAYGLSRVALVTTLSGAIAMMPPEMTESVPISVPPADWRVVLFLVGGAMLSTALFGMAPALQATRLELVRTMRGELTRDARPNRARNGLIALQVGASALLLISAAVFLRSAFAVASEDIGLRTADTIVVEIAGEAKRAAIVNAIAGEPSVIMMGASQPHALAMPPSGIAVMESTSRVPVAYRLASPGYFSALDIPIVRGRTFASGERSVESGVALLSESAARAIAPERDALGTTIRLERADAGASSPGQARQAAPESLVVVGIVRDVPGSRLADWPRALVYLPTTPDHPGTALTLRVRGNVDQVRAALFDRLAPIDPALGEITTMRMMAGVEAFVLRFAFSVTVVLAMLALALTLSGLFSVLSYVVEQRRREIGIRMALGATAGAVTRMMLSQSLRHVAAGLAAGATLAAAMAIVLRSITDGSFFTDGVHVLDPAAYAVSTLCILFACLLASWLPARRAARIDPFVTLKQD